MKLYLDSRWPLDKKLDTFEDDKLALHEELNKQVGLEQLSMGMSADYLKAIENRSTYIRIGTEIFGQRG